jgi:cytochrome c biogenesis factor
MNFSVFLQQRLTFIIIFLILFIIGVMLIRYAWVNKDKNTKLVRAVLIIFGLILCLITLYLLLFALFFGVNS